MTRCAIAAICGLFLTGCAANRPALPTYPDLPAPQAARIVRARLKAIHTIQARGSIILTRPNGDSVQLEAAIVARPPNALHLRAWKFNQTIFDLTLVDGKLWMLNPENPKLRQRLQSRGAGAAQFARTWANLSAGFFGPKDLIIQTRPNNFFFTRDDKSIRITCTVDRRTLVPTQYILLDNQGNRRLTLKLLDYAPHDGIVYPNRFIATSDSGTIDLHLRRVTINGALSPDAFQPSPRAIRVPNSPENPNDESMTNTE